MKTIISWFLMFVFLATTQCFASEEYSSETVENDFIGLLNVFSSKFEVAEKRPDNFCLYSDEFSVVWTESNYQNKAKKLLDRLTIGLKNSLPYNTFCKIYWDEKPSVTKYTKPDGEEIRFIYVNYEIYVFGINI